MIPHDPAIAPDGRRCTFIVRPGHRCNLLEEEHPPLIYVAVLDTGGISFSGRTIVGIGESPEDARAAALKLLLGRKRSYVTRYGDTLRTPQDVADYYGYQEYGPIAVGSAAEA